MPLFPRNLPDPHCNNKQRLGNPFNRRHLGDLHPTQYPEKRDEPYALHKVTKVAKVPLFCLFFILFMPIILSFPLSDLAPLRETCSFSFCVICVICGSLISVLRTPIPLKAFPQGYQIPQTSTYPSLTFLWRLHNQYESLCHFPLSFLPRSTMHFHPFAKSFFLSQPVRVSAPISDEPSGLFLISSLCFPLGKIKPYKPILHVLVRV